MTRPLPHSLLAAGLLVASLLAIQLLSSTLRTHTQHDVGTADAQTEAAVAAALRRELGVDASRIGVRAHGGVVTLTGWVTDDARKHRAEKVTYGVAAVEQVVDEIRVVALPPNPRGM